MARRTRKSRKNKKKSLKFKIFIGFSITFFLIMFTSTLGVLSFVSAAAKEVPKLKNVPKISPAQTSKIYALNKQGAKTLLTNLFIDQDRIVIKLSQIPKHLQLAVIAIEDERFYEHKGVDAKAIIRAVYSNISSGDTVEGGSTITQQYVKNVFLSPEKTLKRKIKEAFLASELERNLPKNKILENYLNTIYFGQSSYGAQSAALKFFGKGASKLSLSQAALLAGVIRSPNKYSPYVNPKLSVKRRDIVLNKMSELKYITVAQKDKALKEPVILKSKKTQATIVPYFVEYVKHELIKKYGVNKVFTGGLRVYTTIDLDMQKKAEDAITETFNRSGDPNASIVTIDNKTGYIKTMASGRDFAKQKFNLAAQGRRQPGSAFKPFVLVTALENGISQNKSYSSSPSTFRLSDGRSWRVRNATEGTGGGMMQLRSAMAKSVNAVFARLVLDVGADKVVRVAKKMGITSPLDPWPAIALGGLRIGVSPLEMASAYSTLSNGGLYNKPIAILKITTPSGRLLYTPKIAPKQAISPATAYIATDILKGVIRSGTGRRANIGRNTAGKTGTTQNYHDAWFVGYTPQLSTAVWVGYADKQIPMRNVHGIRVAGGTFPAQIWASFMRNAMSGLGWAEFPRPSRGITQVKLCLESNLRAREYCPQTYIASFAQKQAPSKLCNIHTTPPPVTVPSFVGLSKTRAENLARESGLKIFKKYQSSSNKQEIILSQSPKTGRIVNFNSTVTLVVSVPPQKIPSVVGMSLKIAESTLSKLGFVVVVEEKTAPGPAKVDKVLSQSPAAGEYRNKGSAITIVIGK